MGVLIVAGALGIRAPGGAAAEAPPPASATEDLGVHLKRIQATCLDLYPPGLRQEMTGRPDPVPEEVRDDPRRQGRYFKTEEKVEKGLFYPSFLDDLLPAFADVIRPGTRFLDLGSGDGRVVFMAALLGARASGIEYDRRLHRIALKARGRLADLVEPARADLRRGDFFEEDLRPYDVLFYYAGGSSMEERLVEKIWREMDGSAVFIMAYPERPLPGLRKVADHGGVVAFRLEGR